MTAISADSTPATDSQSSMNDAGLLPCPFCGGPSGLSMEGGEGSSGMREPTIKRSLPG